MWLNANGSGAPMRITAPHDAEGANRDDWGRRGHAPVLDMPATRRAGGGVLSVLAKVSLLHQQRVMTHDIGTELLFIYSLQKGSPFSDSPLC